MIDKYYNRTDVLIEIATLYYIEGKTQQRIAEVFSTTRSNVAKLLKQALDLGIVEIKIANPATSMVHLASNLIEKFSLKKAIVVPSEMNYQETLVSVGKAAAGFLAKCLNTKITIGISWGTTIYQMVDQFPESTLTSAAVVQLHGGVGSRNVVVDGYEVSSALSRKLHCDAYYIQAPLIVHSKEAKEILVKDKNIARGLEMSKDVDIAFLGIGTTDPELNALLRAGFIDQEEAQSLRAQGAVGMVCGQFYDLEGNLLDAEVNERVIGIPAKDLGSIDTVVGLACGIKKAEAIYGALKGNYLNAIITDESVAKRLLEM